MKHTFWYIDKLVLLLKNIETKYVLETIEEKEKAKKRLEKVEKYDLILRRLIKAHKNQEHLNNLHKSHTDRIPNWSEHVEKHLKKLDELLKVLEKDIPILKRTIDSEPHMWGSRVRDMSFGFILAGIYDEEKSLEHFKKVSVFEIQHLKELIGDIEDVDKILE